MKNKLLLFATALALLSIPKINFGQAPTLGSAADFALFTSDGAVTNTGFSHITGNVGTNNGSSTGFGNVDGVMHDGDAASAQAATDLLIAYNQLDAAIPTFFPAALLGNGDTLEAGVYSIATAATLNGNLTFDAQGDPNAVFIIQIEGSFSTAAGSKVYLINGAQACNVFWKVEGLVDMATGTTMRGTIVANNAGINMNTGDTLEGRALSTTGAISVNGVKVSTPIGCGSPTLTGPVAPALGKAGCFAIFSADGPVTNSGVTYVTGDVGTNTGLTTGYDPLLVSGTIHPNPDTTTAAAATDLGNAYTYLNTLPYDIELLYPAQFGNNLVLTPHTYLLNAATVFTDSLYLDAQDNPNAVFVIQINGALTTSTYSNVILVNGAQAKNVYWLINGAIEIADYSEFSGTIVSQGSIDLLTGVMMDGRALTNVGALKTFAVTVNMPDTCGGGTAFPPTIIVHPASKTVCAGTVVTLSVNATGTGLTYQWRKGTVNITNGGNISGATTATLKFNTINTSNAATDYNVIVRSGSLSDTSNNASITVNTAPAITSQPSNKTVCAGSSASYTVAATGAGLTYQWRKGTVPLTNAGNISGATSSTLTINPVSTLDTASNYNVVVSGSCSPSVTSGNASLTVSTSPAITSQPTDQTECNGGSASFTVTATGSGLTYQWRKGTVVMTNGGNISGVNTPTLTINPVSNTNAATNYNVVVSGTCSPTVNSVNATLSTCTGIEVASMNANITIYPNPFSSNATITIDAAQFKSTELKMYNVLGEEVMNVNLTKQLTTLETGNLPSGIYFYKVIGNGNIIKSGKLVSQK